MVGWAGDPAILTLSDTAHQAVISLEESVEPSLAGAGELASLADWGSKYVGAVARMAGILRLSEHGPDKGTTTPVTAQTVLAAARIGSYFKACAVDSLRWGWIATEEAVYLLGRVRHLDRGEVSNAIYILPVSPDSKRRTICGQRWSGSLITSGYLIPLPDPDPTGGRPGHRVTEFIHQYKSHKSHRTGRRTNS